MGIFQTNPIEVIRISEICNSVLDIASDLTIKTSENGAVGQPKVLPSDGLAGYVEVAIENAVSND